MPAASADSLVYPRDNNIYLANPDGSGAYQVTLDGTAASPYASPSQADDGTIVAVRDQKLYRMTQTGRLLNPPVDTPARAPAPTTRGSHPTDGSSRTGSRRPSVTRSACPA